jgi:hypothetical protein
LRDTAGWNRRWIEPVPHRLAGIDYVLRRIIPIEIDAVLLVGIDAPADGLLDDGGQAIRAQ